MPYVFRGERLRPTIAEYYQTWPFTKHETIALNLFQYGASEDLGGPYWVYLVQKSNNDSGFPVIVRIEDEMLKVDWEVYSEFNGRHLVKFFDGEISSSRIVKAIIQRVSGYYGKDSSQFEQLDDYLVYRLEPPHGGFGEFAKNVFVRKGTKTARGLEAVVGFGEEPLAVMVNVESKVFSHRVSHPVVTEFVDEG